MTAILIPRTSPGWAPVEYTVRRGGPTGALLGFVEPKTVEDTDAPLVFRAPAWRGYDNISGTVIGRTEDSAEVLARRVNGLLGLSA